MIRTISNTTFTLAVISILNFLLVALVANYLGESGVATMGLIILGVSFIMMINNLVGGSALVYLTPRKPLFSVLIVSYGWSLVSAFLMGLLLWFFELVPAKFLYWTVLIGLLECVFSIHNQVFIGKEEMKTHNFLKLIQKSSQVVLFVAIGITLHNFVLALMLSYVATLIFSFVRVFKQLKSFEMKDLKNVFISAFQYGLQIQLSNIVQLMNYRLLYFYIEKSMVGALGIFIIAVQLSESLWIPSKALAIIQYGKISNEEDNRKKADLSVSFLHLSFLVTAIAIVVLRFVPNSWILEIFGKDISGTKPIIYALSLGVMAVALSQSFSHYLSGTGKYSHLITGAILGLLPIVLLGNYCVEHYGLTGAAILTSVSYVFSSAYLGVVFYKKSGLKLKEILLSKTNLFQSIALLRK